MRWPAPRLAVPLAAGAASLAVGVAVTLSLHASATRALKTTLEARLSAAAASAVALLGGGANDAAMVRLAEANGLDGASVVTAALEVRAGAHGGAGRRVDLLRVDAARVKEAAAGRASAGVGYDVGGLPMVVAYAPLAAGPGADVLVLEAGEAFRGDAFRSLGRARALGLLASLVTALALVLVTARWLKSEAARDEAARRAARADSLARLAAAAAHEIRNPLGIIRATVELAAARPEAAGDARAAQSFRDVLEEVERLRGLTDELMELAGERALLLAPVDVGALLAAVAEQVTVGFPGNTVDVRGGAGVEVEGDASRLRQVFLNLLTNAAQAQGTGAIVASVEPRAGAVVLRVRDEGPGVAAAARGQLFEPFFTTRAEGTGLGLAVSRRLVERHGGTLELLDDGGRGACFEVTLPLRARR